jgi:hypothetical protein
LNAALPNPEWHEAFTWMLYRLATYAVINLIDDAAMLSLIFV